MRASVFTYHSQNNLPKLRATNSIYWSECFSIISCDNFNVLFASKGAPHNGRNHWVRKKKIPRQSIAWSILQCDKRRSLRIMNGISRWTKNFSIIYVNIEKESLDWLSSRVLFRRCHCLPYFFCHNHNTARANLPFLFLLSSTFRTDFQTLFYYIYFLLFFLWWGEGQLFFKSIHVSRNLQ